MTPVLELDHVTVRFKRKVALRDVSMTVHAGQTLGIVGESGSGKTTTGKIALGLLRPDSGTVSFLGKSGKRRRGRVQAVLQNPQESLDPRMRIGESIAEPVGVLQGGGLRRHKDHVDAMLRDVGLDPSLTTRYPHELSGGQRQRVSIARALITRPDFVLFDEAVSALDVSVQGRILDLIVRLQAEHGFAALFISHDLAVVRVVSTHVAVMHDGAVVELADTERFYATPEHPYSRRLLEAL